MEIRYKLSNFMEEFTLQRLSKVRKGNIKKNDLKNF